MTTKLDRILKRELTISGEPYTLTLSEVGFVLTLNGRRKGLDIRWADLVGGDAALTTALNASLTANIAPRGRAAATASDAAKRAARPTIARAAVQSTKGNAARPRAAARKPLAARHTPKVRPSAKRRR